MPVETHDYKEARLQFGDMSTPDHAMVTKGARPRPHRGSCGALDVDIRGGGFR